MEHEKISKLIKEIRKNNNLTQKELAEKYNVTYQAVSKWENGKNLPDMMLIKQMSKDFNISLDDLFEGEYKVKESKKRWFNIVYLLLIGFFLLIIIIINKNKDFDFKTLSSECGNFNISGIVSYNKNKSSIYIDNVEYCGGDDIEEYQSIECGLFEEHNDLVKKISTCDKKTNINLEDFLKDINFTIDNYSRICKDFSDNKLFLEITAINKKNTITTYNIPLTLKEQCLN